MFKVENNVNVLSSRVSTIENNPDIEQCKVDIALLKEQILGLEQSYEAQSLSPAPLMQNNSPPEELGLDQNPDLSTLHDSLEQIMTKISDIDQSKSDKLSDSLEQVKGPQKTLEGAKDNPNIYYYGDRDLPEFDVDIVTLSDSLNAKIPEIDQCKSDIAILNDSFNQITSKFSAIDLGKFSEIDQCKSDIATINDSIKRLNSDLYYNGDYDHSEDIDIVTLDGPTRRRREISDINQCKSDIATLYVSLEKFSTIDLKKISEIDQCKSEIATLHDSLEQTMIKFSDINQCKSDIATLYVSLEKFSTIDLKKISEIDQCKSEIATLHDSLEQTMIKFSDIDRCKSNIAELSTSLEKFSAIDLKKISEIDQCKSEIADLHDSLMHNMKKMNTDLLKMMKDIINLKVDRNLIITYKEKTREIETVVKENYKLVEKNNRTLIRQSDAIFDLKSKIDQIVELDNLSLALKAQGLALGETQSLVKNLAQNDKERLEETKTWVPLIATHDKTIIDLKSKIDQIVELDNLVKNLAQNDKERLEETKTWVPLIATHDKTIIDLKSKIEILEQKNGSENDKERLEETKNWIKTWVPLITNHDKDIIDLKSKIDQKSGLNPASFHPKFSLNSKGNFYHDIKQTLFFPTGLIFPEKIHIYSLYITINIKGQPKHKRVFEMYTENSGSPQREVRSLKKFEKEPGDEIIMEDFNPPIEIEAKTAIFITCDRKIDGMVILTMGF
jgi:hypothetical protein